MEVTSNKKLTILHVLPRLDTRGHERTSLDLMNFFALHGHKVIVISQSGKISDYLNRKVIFLQSKALGINPLLTLLKALKIAKSIKKYSVDVLHSHTCSSFWLCRLALIICRRKGRVGFINSMHMRYPGEFMGRLYFARLNRLDALIVASEPIQEHALINYDIAVNKVALIEPGIDLTHFNSQKIKGDRVLHLTKIWDIPEHKKIVLFPSGSVTIKNHGLFLKAISTLKRDDFICVIVGENVKSPLRIALTEAIVRRNMRGIEFVPYISDMPAAYFTSSLVVCLSVKPEAFSRSIIETMAMGKVVVSANSGISSSLIDDGNGFLVDHNVAKEVAAVIDRGLSLSDKDRIVMEKRAISSVGSRFNHLAMCNKVSELYFAVSDN